MIYFVQRGPGGPIKIGYTKADVGRRIKILQTGCPENLILLGYVKGDTSKEKRLHRGLKDHKLNGEWFKPSLMVLGVISSLIYKIGDKTIESHPDLLNNIFTESLQKNEIIDAKLFLEKLKEFKKTNRPKIFLSDGLQLSTEKIKSEMKRLDIETKADLARLMGISKQLVQYYFRTKTIKAASAFGRFLKISPKDLIK